MGDRKGRMPTENTSILSISVGEKSLSEVSSP